MRSIFFLDTLPQPRGKEISVSVYRKPTHIDRYLDLAKRAVVRALMDRAENVCSDPVIIAIEVEHLGKVLCYNNYPQWLIDKQGRLDKIGHLIHPDTGNKIKKNLCFSSLFSRSEWVLQKGI